MGGLTRAGVNYGTELEEQNLDTIADALQRQGYVVLTDVVSDAFMQSLHSRAQNLAPGD